MPLPLETIAGDIKRAIDARLYYPALLVTLTIPEICMGLTMDKSQFVKQKHYVSFVDEFTTPPELGLDGASCYQLRGGLVHRGDLRGHAFFQRTHVIFTVPESGGGIHALSIVAGEKTAAMFDLVTFCSAMVTAARRWSSQNADKPQVVENLKNLIRWCPEGVHPFVGGAPVVASGE
jgi:hypothetical protein